MTDPVFDHLDFFDSTILEVKKTGTLLSIQVNGLAEVVDGEMLRQGRAELIFEKVSSIGEVYDHLMSGGGEFSALPFDSACGLALYGVAFVR